MMNTFIKLDDTKAGMGSLDKEEINKKIVEASLGSLYYETQLKKSENLNIRISNQQNYLASCDPSQFKAATSKMDKTYKELINKQDLSHTHVHIDLDAFFAAVELRDDPTLTSKPVAIGSMQMISTSNYIARRYGVRAAMAGFIGKKLCPDLILLPHNFSKYKKASVMFHTIVEIYDPKFYSGGMDEAYLDLTSFIMDKRFFSNTEDRTFVFKRICTCHCHSLLPDNEIKSQQACCCRFIREEGQNINYHIPGCQLAYMKLKAKNSPDSLSITFGTSIEETVREIRLRIYEAIGVTCSAGIAPTSMLAKVCTDVDKPNGQFMLSGNERSKIDDFLHKLPINKINGIGKVTNALLNSLGIVTCGDIWIHRSKISLLYTDTFCKFILNIYIGGRSHNHQDCKADDSGDEEWKSRKSIGHERTVTRCDARRDESLIYSICSEICAIVGRDMQARSIAGSVVAVKMKSSNFRVMTRMKKLPNPTNDPSIILKFAWELIKPELEIAKKAAQLESKRLKSQKSQYTNTERFFNELSDDLTSIKKTISNKNINNNRDISKMLNNEQPPDVAQQTRELSSIEMQDCPRDINTCVVDFLQDNNSNSNLSSCSFIASDEIEQSKNQIIMKEHTSENPEDFLFLRLLGVRMLKLVNNEVCEKQSKYLSDWIGKAREEQKNLNYVTTLTTNLEESSQFTNNFKSSEINSGRCIENLNDDTSVDAGIDTDDDNSSIYSVLSFESETGNFETNDESYKRKATPPAISHISGSAANYTFTCPICHSFTLTYSNNITASKPADNSRFNIIPPLPHHDEGDECHNFEEYARTIDIHTEKCQPLTSNPNETSKKCQQKLITKFLTTKNDSLT